MKVGDMVRSQGEDEFSKFGYGFIVDEDNNYNSRMSLEVGGYQVFKVLWYSLPGKNKELWLPDWALEKV